MNPTPVTELVPIVNNDHIRALVEMTLATCQSAETRRIYSMRLRHFLASGHPLSREGVALYSQGLREAGAKAAVLQSVHSAIRKLAAEAQLRGLISFQAMYEIKTIPVPQATRAKAGNWLTVAQVRQLLALPDRSTYMGKRDAAILSILVGCALRRAEMATLPWSCYQSREGRMCLVDLDGKGDKSRTVPVPLWAQADVDTWRIVCQSPPPVEKTGDAGRNAHRAYDSSLITGGLGYEGLFDLVELYGNRLGVDLAPHDLRRTLAQMLRRNGAPLEQIQATLGHAKLETTAIYLGSNLELAPGAASVDQLDLGAGR